MMMTFRTTRSAKYFRAQRLPLINVGCGEDQTVADLARGVASVVGFRGALEFDSSKPDGTPRKLLDVSRLRKLGWSPRIDLEAGIAAAYKTSCPGKAVFKPRFIPPGPSPLERSQVVLRNNSPSAARRAGRSASITPQTMRSSTLAYP